MSAFFTLSGQNQFGLTSYEIHIDRLFYIVLHEAGPDRFLTEIKERRPILKDKVVHSAIREVSLPSSVRETIGQLRHLLIHHYEVEMNEENWTRMCQKHVDTACEITGAGLMYNKIETIARTFNHGEGKLIIYWMHVIASSDSTVTQEEQDFLLKVSHQLGAGFTKYLEILIFEEVIIANGQDSLLYFGNFDKDQQVLIAELLILTAICDDQGRLEKAAKVEELFKRVDISQEVYGTAHTNVEQCNPFY